MVEKVAQFGGQRYLEAVERALIIGCGYTGGALAGRLRAAGVPVTGTSASGGAPVTGTSAGGAPAGDLSLGRLDLLEERGDLELPEAAGAVVYYMVSTLTRRYDPERRPHMRPLERCLAALARQPVAGLVYLSSTSVYGDQQGRWVDEQTPVAPLSPWGRMRVELERRVWDFGAERDLPACVVRLPEIYGPGRGPLERLRRGYVMRYPQRYSNRIHVDDLARVLDRLGRALDQPLLLVADGAPATTREVYQYAAKLLGLGSVPEAAPGAADPGTDANRRGLLSESKRCRADRLLSWLGAPLRYPSYREGLAAILTS
jgi:nucleoside-diphosphate-sugar epimerase